MSAQTDAPEWARALLNAVEEFEETHPKTEWCLDEALEGVPGEVRTFARGIRHHIRQTSKENPE